MADTNLVKKAREIGAINLNAKPDSENTTEMKLGIYSSPQPCFDTVKLVAVHGGGGITIHKRLHHAVKAVLRECASMKGRNEIYILTGKRETTPSEILRIKDAGFTPAESEFELALSAIQDLFPGAKTKELPSITATHKATEHSIRCHAAKVMYFGNEIQITIFETSYDPKRELSNDDLAMCAGFEEAMLPLTSAKTMFVDQKIYFVSHDIWQPWAKAYLQKLMPHTTIVGNGPYNLDRWSNSGLCDDMLEIKDEDQLKAMINAYDELIG